MFLFVDNPPLLHLFHSFKHVKSITKNNNSPLFCKGEKKNLVFRAIYDLLSLGIRSQVKKDVVLLTLNDISVSVVHYFFSGEINMMIIMCICTVDAQRFSFLTSSGLSMPKHQPMVIRMLETFSVRS